MHGELRGITGDAHADESNVGGEIIDAVRHNLAELFVLEVVHVYALRIQAGIALSHFANIFQNIDSVFRTLDGKSDEKLGIYRTPDGAVVATFPMGDALLDETVAALPYFSLLANSEGKSWMGWTRIGGKNHLVAARRMRGWPLKALACPNAPFIRAHGTASCGAQ